MKDLKDSLKELGTYKKPRKMSDGKGYEYYSINDYYNRMDEVFGPDGYQKDYSDYQTHQMSDKQMVISLKCTITLKDYDYSVSAYGTSEVKFSSTNGSFIGLNNVGNNANHQAFKAACNQLGIFGIRSEEDAGSEEHRGSSSQRSYNSKSDSGSSNASVETEVFVTMPLENLGTNADGKEMYRLVGELKDGTSVDVLLYPNYLASNPNLIENLTKNIGQNGKRLKFTFKGKEVAEEKRKGASKKYSKTYTFCSFVKAALTA